MKNEAWRMENALALLRRRLGHASLGAMDQEKDLFGSYTLVEKPA